MFLMTWIDSSSSAFWLLTKSHQTSIASENKLRRDDSTPDCKAEGRDSKVGILGAGKHIRHELPVQRTFKSGCRSQRFKRWRAMCELLLWTNMMDHGAGVAERY